MEKDRKLIIAGNWKMNKTVAEALTLIHNLKRDLNHITEIDIIICPPYTALSDTSRATINTNIRLGAQNMSPHPAGPHTGEIAAEHLKEFLVRYVILGHSERRQHQNETDTLIAQKIKTAHAATLKPILCIGETLQQRQNNQTNTTLDQQLTTALQHLTKQQTQNTTIAYEPIWAIGTGKTATPQQAQQTHQHIRAKIAQLFDTHTAQHTRIQYGGSVKPNNARQLMSQPDIDGALVGGASLDDRTFTQIITNSI